MFIKDKTKVADGKAAGWESCASPFSPVP